ncbi:MAG: 50S ribosomal protein L10 [Pigeon pea little leaf phytoplasma]|uniref:Large ribosomal subunit protein uL10 n=1 Tax=Candidatus Phytoplasma fabacearum TaxID=2982628 RepID=A0ABU8ZSS2_9MOLU|nr:50S ribosomal protein L10 ['Bituminaria bituminosa' little leaf phytoplasma]MDV3148636.1 50S ribosomal protein L10 [Pigeon pea little leaf phytoplasma]MDO7983511.1 50S ribosomal protein L10 ['Bituminaria bituminosa' little leaf phytoplasma]MDO8023803.1 50S ribosomal protein L10 ['Bituminaria bituminosa' little leaf phytoplasma]MDO8030631.1 50S ribosomal protein L10 ['Bituminaria bituminosa' little leaf phytoplasma]MDV3154102.1 50S ribosomal protein L10 [Pigeon pea little leaf phytoplasma]
MLKSVIKEKSNYVDYLSQNIDNSNLVVLLEFKGSKVSDLTNLRRKLRELVPCKFQVVPNNIIKRALIKSKYDELIEFKNPKALFWTLSNSSDIFSSLNALYKFSKMNEFLKINFGIIENEICSLEQIIKLAQIPSKSALLSMLLFSVSAPVKNIITVLQLLIQKNKKI